MKKFLAAAILVLSTNFASAGTTIIGNGPQLVMPGYRDWCLRHGAECDNNVREPRVIEYTPQVTRDMALINATVNLRVEYQFDEVQYHSGDYWEYPQPDAKGVLRGDCEDYAILKRKMLRDLGYPHRAMRIASLFTETGEGHAVLIVRTTNGDYVLDMYHNKKDPVVLWNQKKGYKWSGMESQEPNDHFWVYIGVEISK